MIDMTFYKMMIDETFWFFCKASSYKYVLIQCIFMGVLRQVMYLRREIMIILCILQKR